MTPIGAWPRGSASPVENHPRAASMPTVWGLTPFQLHDRFWASLGVQVVRAGQADSAVSSEPLLYLLLDPKALVLFDLQDDPALLNAGLLYIRLHDARDRGVRERVITDAHQRFLRFERIYDRPRSRLTRAALTADPAIASLWRRDVEWKSIRQHVSKPDRSTMERTGFWYDGSRSHEVAAFVRQLTRHWSDPSRAIERAVSVSQGVWRDRDVTLPADARCVGPVWIGRGRQPDAGSLIVGPSVLWDDPNQRPAMEPYTIQPHGARQLSGRSTVSICRSRRSAKRWFDITLAVLGLAITLPFYPLIFLAIWLEDGRPLFFAHRRETLNGREFACIKFRSMRRNAEHLKAKLQARNQADGPQFFLENDPRLTRVGHLLRRFRIDEWPQFFNVLRGDMSIVGPRPSPFRENQFCPLWRKLRLSVRPGITGLWQVARTRSPGADFQEWIRYDIEYVEKAGFWFDLRIICRTVGAVLRHPGGIKR